MIVVESLDPKRPKADEIVLGGVGVVMTMRFGSSKKGLILKRPLYVVTAMASPACH
jgi:hypothetical protein